MDDISKEPTVVLEKNKFKKKYKYERKGKILEKDHDLFAVVLFGFTSLPRQLEWASVPQSPYL